MQLKLMLEEKAEQQEFTEDMVSSITKAAQDSENKAQKAMEAQRPTTAAEREKELAEAAKRPMRISKQAPLVNQMTKVFEGEHALLELLLQAREDGDADEIVARWRTGVLTSQEGWEHAKGPTDGPDVACI